MQNNDALKALISENLSDGEVVLWAGKPEDLKLLDTPYGTPVIIRWIICLILAASGLWYGFIFARTAENLNVNTNLITIVWLAVAVILALWPLMDLSKLKRKCSYYITNKRALLLLSGISNTLKEKTLADITEITFDMIEAPRGNIYFGNKQKNSDKKARISALTPPMGPEDDALPLIFHSVMNPEDILALLPNANKPQ